MLFLIHINELIDTYLNIPRQQQETLNVNFEMYNSPYMTLWLKNVTWLTGCQEYPCDPKMSCDMCNIIHLPIIWISFFSSCTNETQLPAVKIVFFWKSLFSPIAFSVSRKFFSLEVIKTVHGVKINCSSIIYAAKKNDYERVKILLRYGYRLQR